MINKNHHYAVVYRDHDKWKIYRKYNSPYYVMNIFPTLLNKTLRQFECVHIEPIDKHTGQFIDDYTRDKFDGQ